MGSFISIIKAVIALLPILRDLITAAEAVFPAQGSGVQKLELVKALIQNAYDAATEFEAPFASVWPVLSSVITHVVPLFTKSSAAAQVDTTAAQVATLAPDPTVHAAVAASVASLVRPSAPVPVSGFGGVQLASTDA